MSLSKFTVMVIAILLFVQTAFVNFADDDASTFSDIKGNYVENLVKNWVKNKFISDAPTFSDIKGNYAEKLIKNWIKKDFIKGMPDGSFAPSRHISRAEFVSLLSRAFKLATTQSIPKTFNDVNPDDWYFNDINNAAKLEIISGYKNGNFGANDPIKRQDAAVIVSRYLDLFEVFEKSTPVNFSDKNLISDYAADHISAMTELKLITGRPDGTFAPKENINRADAVVLLNNVYRMLAGTTGITGKIYSDHKALAGADIKIIPDGDYKPAATVKSDENGLFSADLSSGFYDIIASKDGYVTLKGTISVRSGYKSYVKLNAEKGQTVTASLKDADGRKLKNTAIYFKTNPYFSTISDKDGFISTVLPKNRDFECFYEKGGKLLSRGKFSTKAAVDKLNLGAIDTTNGIVPLDGSLNKSNTSNLRIPVLKLIGDNGIMQFSLENTDSSHSYKILAKLNREKFVTISDIDISTPISFLKPSIPGLYTYKITATHLGRSADSNEINYVITSDGYALIETDTDGDWLEDSIELKIGTDPNIKDTDGDSLPDGLECFFTYTNPLLADTDSNGVKDSDEDADSDKLANLKEYLLGSNPAKFDSDSDGLDDGIEINTYNTNPLVVDTDGDTLSDYDETVLKLDPLKKKTDDVTNDPERIIEQKASTRNFGSTLLEDNDAIPNLTVYAKGNIGRTLAISEHYSPDIGQSRSIIGKPIEIEGIKFDSAKLEFSLNATSVNSGPATAMNTKLICEVNDEGDTVYYETDRSADGKVLTANINRPGIYFVLDIEILFSELGLSLPSEMINPKSQPPSDLSGFSAEKEFTREQLDSMSNERTVYNDGTVTTDNAGNNDFHDSSKKDEPGLNENSEADSHNFINSSEFELKVDFASNETEKLITSGVTESSGQADIVFIIDTSGSMSDKIKNVKNNLSAFVDYLKSRGVSAQFALVDFKDIHSDGYNSTRVHKNGFSNWFSDVKTFKNILSSLKAEGGGDSPECAIDALETARLLNMRVNASKFFILLTDASYKLANRYDIPSMAYEIELLKNQKITTSLVSSQFLKSEYNDLMTETGGVFADINGNFRDELMIIAYKIKNSTVDDGKWVYLYGLVPTAAKLKALPTAGSTLDTDDDGITDIDELESYKPSKTVDLDYIIHIASKGVISGTKYGKVATYKYKSNPAVGDTDEDGYNDDVDLNPKNIFRTPIILLHE